MWSLPWERACRWKNMSLHNIDRAESGNGLTHEQKNHELYLREKEMLDLFLAHGAITRAQHDKSLHDLTEKMGEHAAAQPQG